MADAVQTHRRLSTGAGATRTSSRPTTRSRRPRRGAREHLGFEPVEVERPVPLEASTCRAPRLAPPASLAAICRSDPYERAVARVRQGLPRHGPRVPRAASTTRPTWWPTRATRASSRRLLAWCADAGAAAIPFGGGTSVVGGVEPALPASYAGAVTIDLRRARPRARGRRGLARRADPGRAPPARRSRTSSASTASRCATSRSRSSTRRSAAGSPRARAATSPPLPTHIDDLVESVRALTPAGRLGEPAAAGLGRGPEPRPDAARLGGDPRA